MTDRRSDDIACPCGSPMVPEECSSCGTENGPAAYLCESCLLARGEGDLCDDCAEAERLSLVGGPRDGRIECGCNPEASPCCEARCEGCAAYRIPAELALADAILAWCE